MVFFMDTRNAPHYRLCRRCRRWFGDDGSIVSDQPSGTITFNERRCKWMCAFEGKEGVGRGVSDRQLASGGWRWCEGVNEEPKLTSPNMTYGNCPECGLRMRLHHRLEAWFMPPHYTRDVVRERTAMRRHDGDEKWTCNCGDPVCEGWQWVTPGSIDAKLQTEKGYRRIDLEDE